MPETPKQIATVFVLVALLVMPKASAQRAMPPDNLAYPVLITFKGSTGSGFYLATATTMYLVTAKHVLFDPATQGLREPKVELLSYSADASDPKPYILTVGSLPVLGKGRLAAHTSEDVAVVRVASLATDPTDGKRKVIVLPGITINERSDSGTGSMVGADVKIVKTFDQVFIGNEVVVFGYPTSIGLQALPQIDSRRPLLRKGIVAGDNRAKRTIILEYPLSGQSWQVRSFS